MVSSLKITLLVDNNAVEGLAKEHGFSAWIEADGKYFLFDTGQASAFQTNVERLGIPLEKADALILSHGHYDHTGNIPLFLSLNDKARVYMGNTCHIDRWSCKPGTAPRSIGIPVTSRQVLLAQESDRLQARSDPVRLMPGVGVTGVVPRHSDLEDTGGPFFLDNTSHAPDVIEDDQSMWFETARGIVILLGCCHAGLINTIEHIRRVSGIHTIRGVIGGMHLLNAGEERLAHTLSAIKEWQAEFMVPCHCTGDEQMKAMRAFVGEETVTPGYAGMVITVQSSTHIA
jgi:7,8-dihydropterin-6-yl-methyl-4-(beta-D-ribofuranosyl)aminobenzene 5'-phosphate synthase